MILLQAPSILVKKGITKLMSSGLNNYDLFIEKKII